MNKAVSAINPICLVAAFGLALLVPVYVGKKVLPRRACTTAEEAQLGAQMQVWSQHRNEFPFGLDDSLPADVGSCWTASQLEELRTHPNKSIETLQYFSGLIAVFVFIGLLFVLSSIGSLLSALRWKVRRTQPANV